MNKQTFISLLKELDEACWQAIVDGGVLLMVDDFRLEVGALNAPNAILLASNAANAASLRAESLSQAGTLLDTYYRTHPLTRKGFTTQANALVVEYGRQAFASQKFTFPERTLFVEGGELMAESRDSPRHRYGAFCELEKTLDHVAVVAEVDKWLESGAAHERYLEMNVCRYAC